MTQTDRLLAWLQSGKSIEPLEALRELGIYRLAARIRDLRAAGHAIHTETVGVRCADGAAASVARYSLAVAPRQACLFAEANA
jgi:hypothetical protein